MRSCGHSWWTARWGFLPGSHCSMGRSSGMQGWMARHCRGTAEGQGMGSRGFPRKGWGTLSATWGRGSEQLYLLPLLCLTLELSKVAFCPPPPPRLPRAWRHKEAPSVQEKAVSFLFAPIPAPLWGTFAPAAQWGTHLWHTLYTALGGSVCVLIKAIISVVLLKDVLELEGDPLSLRSSQSPPSRIGDPQTFTGLQGYPALSPPSGDRDLPVHTGLQW